MSNWGARLAAIAVEMGIGLAVAAVAAGACLLLLRSGLDGLVRVTDRVIGGRVKRSR